MKPKIPMIIIAVLLLLQGIPMIAIPVAFDKDYFPDELDNPTSEEGVAYEGLAAHNKVGLGAMMSGLAILLLLNINRPEREAKRLFFQSMLCMMLPTFLLIGLGGARDFVDAPPTPAIIMGLIFTGLAVYVWNSPDEDEAVNSSE
ncbi:hypothetical protein N9O16_02315 [Candidatus Poseidoniaceae archaeon]|nr:hypothetical protein [Euryarchaeota archaeon]MDA8701430.1 hypothetical protein [Euryarchaeota archaeon]MDA9166306.1 hypothetical protein [Candidatus Poseidoniaceae archaeon]MDC0655341.1 hypothetical protein [Candidatus Poseidoniaceae archaeon]